MKTLITGGSASEKSKHAEDRTLSHPGTHVYLATMEPYSEAGKARIKRHQELRAGKGFFTIERTHDMASIDLEPAKASAPGQPVTVLLECLGNLLANEMFPMDGPPRCTEEAADAVLEDVLKLSDRVDHLVVVTNDIGRALDPYSPETQAYIFQLGRLSNILATHFDRVIEVVADQEIILKERA